MVVVIGRVARSDRNGSPCYGIARLERKRQGREWDKKEWESDRE